MEMTMATPPNSAHYILFGGLPGGERWAAGMWALAGGTSSAQQQAQAALDDLINGGASGGITPLWSTGTTLEGVQCYEYDGSGNLSDSGESQIANPLPGTGTTTHPNQISLVLTIRSANRSRSGRNRMYLPATGCGMQANGLATAATVNTAVDAMAGWMTDRGVRVASPSAGVLRVATSIDADYILDQQTRRREQLASTRHSHTL